MTTRIAGILSHALVFSGAVAGVAGPADAQSPLPPVRREFPLNCRGGAGLVFDTLLVIPDSGRVRLMLTFAANATTSGLEGEGLEPGSCAWMDRPLTDAEPRRIQFAIGTTDSAPQQTVRDSGIHWGFLAYNSDSGYLTGVGYRHWDASSPQAVPPDTAAPVLTTRAPRRIRLPFDIRYLPLAAVALGAIVSAPLVTLIGRWSGWRRLADHYPDRNNGRARSFRSGQLVMHMSVYRGGVRLTPDESYLHFAPTLFMRPGHRAFSVPWSDIEATPDGWPWFPLKGHPVVRLTLAADPELRILVQVKDAKRIFEGSGGRLEPQDPQRLTTAAHR